MTNNGTIVTNNGILKSVGRIKESKRLFEWSAERFVKEEENEQKIEKKLSIKTTGKQGNQKRNFISKIHIHTYQDKEREC